jgi:hypothetical protein
MPQLEITVTAANVKKLDEKAYNVTNREGWVRVELGDQVFETKRVIGDNGLDPIWEETHVFEVGTFLLYTLNKLFCTRVQV